MAKIGFFPVTPSSKDLGHKECPITIEFPARTIMLGSQSSHVTHVEKIEGVAVKILSPTQSVMDRLAGYIHWDDAQNLDQAEWICERQPVSLDKVKKCAQAEGASQEQLNKILETSLNCCRKELSDLEASKTIDFAC